jgi:hypothetical protein
MTLVRQELDSLHSTTLAVLCEKLAEAPGSDPATVAKSRELKTEWLRLQAPPSMTLKEEKEKDGKRWDLRKRMVEFLEGRDEVDLFPKP